VIHDPGLDLSDPSGECDFHIVGESNYQPELRRIAKSGRTFLAVLMRERPIGRTPMQSRFARKVAERSAT